MAQISGFTDQSGNEINPLTPTLTSGSPLPSFIIFNNVSSTLIFSPSLNSQIGLYSITIPLYDPYFSSTYTFNLIVQSSKLPPTYLPSIMNAINKKGPPVFVEALQILQVEVGKTTEYSLPKVTTPSNDPFNITVNLQDSLTFTQYSSTKFIFSPQINDLKSDSYIIKITLRNV